MLVGVGVLRSLISCRILCLTLTLQLVIPLWKQWRKTHVGIVIVTFEVAYISVLLTLLVSDRVRLALNRTTVRNTPTRLTMALSRFSSGETSVSALSAARKWLRLRTMT